MILSLYPQDLFNGGGGGTPRGLARGPARGARNEPLRKKFASLSQWLHRRKATHHAKE